MTDRTRPARRLRRGRVVFATPAVPAWVPEPADEVSRWRRVVRRGPGGALQPVGEAALRAVSDGSAVLSIVRR